MVFDLKLHERRYVLCGAQQKLVTEHWELPKDKSKTIYPPLQTHLLHKKQSFATGGTGILACHVGQGCPTYQRI